MARRIPGAELLSIEGGDHVSIFTHRQLVRGRVAAFLERSLKSGAAGSTAAG